MKKLLIFILPLYFYIVTVLTEYGFSSYFNIPPNFVEASLRENIIYFFQLFSAGTIIVGLMKWWMWLILIVSVLIIAFLYWASNFLEKVFILIAFIFLIYSAWGSYNFGMSLAANTTIFYAPTSDCNISKDNQKFIAPIMYDSKAVFVPIDEHNKINGGFTVKETSDLPCQLQQQNIGKITK